MHAHDLALTPSHGLSVHGGPYELRQEIGVGGAARVFTAVDANAPWTRILAAKTLRPSLACDPRHIRGLLHEARLLSSLAHPNVVEVFDYGFQDGDALMVMEYVQGVSLGRLMRLAAAHRLTVPEPIALYIALEVLRALDYIHRPHGAGDLGLVHRDVSPGNVLVDFRGAIKLVDFGIAREARPAVRMIGTVCGKPGYLSPEQARGEQVDQRSDLFSLAVILAELLMECRLFSGRTPAEAIECVLRGDLSALDKMGDRVPAGLARILTVALHADAEERFQTARGFEDALLDFVAREGQLLPTSHGVGRWLIGFGIIPHVNGIHAIPDDPTSPERTLTSSDECTMTWESSP